MTVAFLWVKNIYIAFEGHSHVLYLIVKPVGVISWRFVELGCAPQVRIWFLEIMELGHISFLYRKILILVIKANAHWATNTSVKVGKTAQSKGGETLPTHTTNTTGAI